MFVADVSRIRRILEDERRGVRVRDALDGHPDWILKDGALVHRDADYFRVLAHRDVAGRRRMMLHQSEPALVALLVARHGGEWLFLLSVRSEPGLIGTTCLSTTIQSTQSNFLRRHGGRATPYLDLATDHNSGRVVYESKQFDWGDVYDGKTKRFVIVEVESGLSVEPGFVWVTRDTARRLLLAEHLITNDLRACLTSALDLLESDPRASDALTSWSDDPPQHDRPDGPETTTDVSLVELMASQDGRVRFLDDVGSHVSFHRTTARSREVAEWVQPLLGLEDVRRITLYRVGGSEARYAIRRVTQPGSLGLSLWTPSIPIAPLVGEATRTATSGEGGRFLRHRIELGLITLEGARGMDGRAWPEDTEWMSEQEVRAATLQSLATTLELRLARSLLWGVAHP